MTTNTTTTITHKGYRIVTEDHWELVTIYSPTGNFLGCARNVKAAQWQIDSVWEA